jgi:hypothetical protein
MTACSNVQIPQQSQAFIYKYFSSCSIVLVEIEDEEDGREYSVWLNDGTRIEFDLQGNWKRVARKKSGVPLTLIPNTIQQYVKTNYPNDVVTKFSKKDYGFKLELSDDMDLRFNKQGQFIEVVD